MVRRGALVRSPSERREPLDQQGGLGEGGGGGGDL